MAQSPVDVGPRLPTWAVLTWPSSPASQIETARTPKVDVADVLAAWRAAERRLETLLEASPMRTLVRSEVARLRAEYHRIFDERARSNWPW